MQELAQLRNITDLARALEVYTERHYKRLGRLQQSTFVLDFLLNDLQVYEELSGVPPTAQGVADGTELADPRDGPAGHVAADDRLAALTYSHGIAPLVHSGAGAAVQAKGAAQQSANGFAAVSANAQISAPIAAPTRAAELPSASQAQSVGSSSADTADALAEETGGDLAGWGAGFASASLAESVDDQPASGSGRKGAEHLQPYAPAVDAAAASDEETDEDGTEAQRNGALGVGVLAPHKLAKRASAALDGKAANGKRKDTKCKHRAQQQDAQVAQAAEAAVSRKAVDGKQHQPSHKRKKARRGSDGDAGGGASVAQQQPHKKRKRHSAPG